MIPLPPAGETAIKLIGINHHLIGAIQLQFLGYLAVGIAQDRPTVSPSAGHECEYSAHCSAILEDQSVPFIIRCIHDGTLPHIIETTKLRFQNLLLRPRSGN